MRRPDPKLWALALLAAPLAARAQEPATSTLTSSPTVAAATPALAAQPIISSHQIDRFDAIAMLQKTLKADPRSLADWVILGELAHEVALDSPADQADTYFKLSSDAYQRALALAPNNAGLKAAVQFARDQEAHSAQFEKSRDAATATYLDARRRDLAATGYTPTLRVLTPPVPSRELPRPAAPIAGTGTIPTIAPVVDTTTTPGTGTAPTGSTSTIPLVENPTRPGPKPVATETEVSTPVAGVRQIYSAPVYPNMPAYQPYVQAGQASPYTYDQYSSSYYPQNYYSTPGTQPVTMQRYIQQLPSTLLNSAGRPIVPGATARPTGGFAPVRP